MTTTLDPKPAVYRPMRAAAPRAVSADNLGALAELPGTWVGEGFNLIFLPDKQNNAIFRTKMNATVETIAFTPIGGAVPNRGSVQGDIFLHGLHYLQQVSDAATFEALHLEPGLWLNVPPTSDPSAPATIVRQATIPHGDSLLAQSILVATIDGPPPIAPVSTTPTFPDGKPVVIPGYLEPFYTAPTPPGIPEEAKTNPNVILTDTLAAQRDAGQTVVSTTTIKVSTKPKGGLVNIPFIVANADAISMESVFWIETVEQPDGSRFMQLQYSQTVILRFVGIDWPHVSVATLVKQ